MQNKSLNKLLHLCTCAYCLLRQAYCYGNDEARDGKVISWAVARSRLSAQSLRSRGRCHLLPSSLWVRSVPTPERALFGSERIWGRRKGERWTKVGKRRLALVALTCRCLWSKKFQHPSQTLKQRLFLPRLNMSGELGLGDDFPVSSRACLYLVPIRRVMVSKDPGRDPVMGHVISAGWSWHDAQKSNEMSSFLPIYSDNLFTNIKTSFKMRLLSHWDAFESLSGSELCCLLVRSWKVWKPLK